MRDDLQRVSLHHWAHSISVHTPKVCHLELVERSWPPAIGQQHRKHRNKKKNTSVSGFLHRFCVPQDLSTRLRLGRDDTAGELRMHAKTTPSSVLWCNDTHRTGHALAVRLADKLQFSGGKLTLLLNPFLFFRCFQTDGMADTGDGKTLLGR